jgi:hypothetical protein
MNMDDQVNQTVLQSVLLRVYDRDGGPAVREQVWQHIFSHMTHVRDIRFITIGHAHEHG